MTDRAKTLTDEVIGLLYRRVGAATATNADVGEVLPYDWNAPSSFTPAQMKRLEKLATAAAGKLSEAIEEQLRSKLTVKCTAVAQHYAPSVAEALGEGKFYYVPLKCGVSDGGFLAVKAGMVVSMSEALLGGAFSADRDERALSPLEFDLLLDVMRSVTKALCEGMEQPVDTFQHDGKIVEESPAAAAAVETEYFRMAFVVEEWQGAPLFTAALASTALKSAVTASKEKAATSTDASEHARNIQTHLEEAVIVGDVWVGNASVTIGAAAMLEPGDVLLLGTGPHESVELRVQGKPVLHGVPVECEGFYALYVQGQGRIPAEA
jgi:flagellar motor switch protein FliM